MTLLESLKFVKNGYAKDDIIPQLAHFVIREGRITAYNGTMGMSCPIAFSDTIAPQAGHFYKCIDTCDEEPTLTIEKGRLRIKSGGFKAIVNCIPFSDVPAIIPKGYRYPIAVEMIPTLTKLIRFHETDNPKDFANGILLKGASAFVTNGKVMIEAWIGANFPTVNIPKKALQELCRNGEDPEAILIDESMIFFMLPGDKWIATKYLVSQWPDLDFLFERESHQTAPPAGFWEALERMNKFADPAGKCYFQGSQMATQADLTVDGAAFDCPGLPATGIYNSRELVKLKDMATAFDFSVYPDPVLFSGDKLRGALVGYTR